MFMITRGSCVVLLRKSKDNKYTYDFVSCTWIIDDVFFCGASSCKNNFLSFTSYTLPGVLKSIGSRILGIASFHIFPPIWNYKFCLGRSNPWLFHDFELIINQLAICYVCKFILSDQKLVNRFHFDFTTSYAYILRSLDDIGFICSTPSFWILLLCFIVCWISNHIMSRLFSRLEKQFPPKSESVAIWSFKNSRKEIQLLVNCE